ncbi:MAG: rRNA maturation RNase YbeY [bacterium]|nr:rRNA maturation RNase YbeY [bacterium]
MLDLVFQNSTLDKSFKDDFFVNIIRVALGELDLDKKNIEVSINLVGENKIKELNKKYRNKNKVTDVLSFPLRLAPLAQVKSNAGVFDLGDIFICLSIAKKEAKRENIDIERKLAQLTVHGFLHLAGYDHENSIAEAKKMEKLEEDILRKTDELYD